MKVLLLNDPPLPGPVNMAVDSCLAGMAGEGVFDLALRTYTWDPHTVSLGRLEKGLDRLDRPRLQADGFGLVRRPTGGRAVWHGRELTYSVTAGASHPLYSQGIENSLGAVASVLVNALAALGVPATVNAPGRSARGFGGGPCFVSHGRFEVMTPDGRKLVGSAQARTKNAFLEHGSILFDNDQPRILDYTMGLTGEAAATFRRQLQEGTATVREFVPGACCDDLVPLLDRSFTDFWGVAAETADHSILPAPLLRELAERHSL